MEIVGVKPQMADEFHQIIGSRMIRRTKDIVLPYLPEKVYQTRYAPMDSKQAKAYKQMTDHMMAQIDDGLIAATNPLTLMTRLSQFASSYAELDPNGDVHLSDPSNKLDALMEIVAEAAGQPIVVFAQSKQLIDLAAKRLKKAGIEYGRITGDDSVQARQDDIDRFQRGELPVMLATLAAGGVGITLTAARVAVFLQRSWSMVDNKQAEDRIHRPGAENHDSIEIIDIVSKGTIEEYRAEKLAEKEDRLQEVVRDDVLRAMLKYRGD
jgi:SNF2 family DNA or RNA helicase